MPLLRREVPIDDGAESRRTRGEGRIGGHPSDSHEIHSRKRAAGIETIPTEPENESAGDRDRQIVRQHGRAAVALELTAEPWAQNDCASQRDEPADGVHDGRAGEIMKAYAHRREHIASAAHVREPAVWSPRPMADHRINETSDANAV